MSNFGKKIIEVCDQCGRACCWYGEFMCDDAQSAGTVKKTVNELRAEKNGENERYWEADYMSKVYGDDAPFGYED